MREQEQYQRQAEEVMKEIVKHQNMMIDADAFGGSNRLIIEWIRLEAPRFYSKALQEAHKAGLEEAIKVCESKVVGDYKDCPEAWMSAAFKIIATEIRSLSKPTAYGKASGEQPK